MFGISCGLKLHRSNVARKVQSKVAVLKAHTSQSMDRLKARMVTWSVTVKTGVLYTCAALPSTKSWLKELEDMQNELGSQMDMLHARKWAELLIDMS
jgi:hypothetical protein